MREKLDPGWRSLDLSGCVSIRVLRSLISVVVH
uniref:Uncharacterized protein n=1 Tax=Arundo donax TaxID=35708 RepID=A0A0A9B5B9_ARUDO